jgi:hypothetical protein
MIVLYGSRRLRGKVCCWAAFLAKSAACVLVRLLSLGSDIHARMTVRRTAALAIADLPLKIPHDRDAASGQANMSNIVARVTPAFEDVQAACRINCNLERARADHSDAFNATLARRLIIEQPI